MPHFEDLYPGRFLKGVTLAQPKTIRIVAFVPETLEGDDGKKQPKAILKYKDRTGDGEMVCCKTNAALIAAMFGADYSAWPGKLITIHFDANVRFGAEKPGGIRVLGSPEIASGLSVELKRPRRKKLDVYMLIPTGQKPKQGTQQEQSGAAVSGGFSARLDAAQTRPELDRIYEDAKATLTGDELAAATRTYERRCESLGQE